MRTHELNNLSKDSNQLGYGKVETMTTYEHEKILRAVNEFADIPHDVADIDEALDFLNYDEILDAFVADHIADYKTISYRDIKHYMEEFFTIIPKTADELNIY